MQRSFVSRTEWSQVHANPAERFVPSPAAAISLLRRSYLLRDIIKQTLSKS
jgi:hypothetical protein